jgi:hypothetical protein
MPGHRVTGVTTVNFTCTLGVPNVHACYKVRPPADPVVLTYRMGGTLSIGIRRLIGHGGQIKEEIPQRGIGE